MRIISSSGRRTVVASSGAVLLATITGCAEPSGPDASPTAPSAQTSSGEAPAQWSYEGASGPEHWGELDEDFTTCSTGTAQSPIDVADSTALSPEPIELDYGVSDVLVRDTGHTVELEPRSPQSITVDGTRFELLQIHYHAPAEHTLDGQGLDAEFHFVHRSDDDRLAVVGVLAAEGQPDAPWSSVVDAVTAAPDGSPTEVADLDLASLLPDSLDHYAYDGSLTTPPCSENVRWLLLQTPVELSAEQIDALRSVHSGNNRPTQPLHDRDVAQAAR